MDVLLWGLGNMAWNRDMLWMVPYEQNLLCGYNVKTDSLEECYAWDKNSCRIGASNVVACWRDCIVQIPNWDCYIHLLSDDGKTCDYLIEDNVNGKEEKFGCVQQVENVLYMFPVVRKYILKWSSAGMEKIDCEVSGFSSCTKCGTDIYLTNETNTIWKFDTKTEKMTELVKMEEQLAVHWCGCFEGIIYFAAVKGEIYTWNEDGVQKYDTLPFELNEDYVYQGIKTATHFFFFLRNDASAIYVKDLQSNQYSRLLLEKDQKYNEKWTYNAFGVPLEKNGEIYIMSAKHRAIFVISANGKSVTRKHIMFNTNKFSSKCHQEAYRQVTNEELFLENALLGLDDFADYVKKAI